MLVPLLERSRALAGPDWRPAGICRDVDYQRNRFVRGDRVHWPAIDDGGELVIHRAGDAELRVAPRFGTLAVFLSEEVEHEVLPASRPRYSVTGWFRINGSIAGEIDPPR